MRKIGTCLKIFTFLIAVNLSPALKAKDVPVTVTVDVHTKKCIIPSGFQGLSYEEPTIMGSPQGGHYFDPKNGSLVNLMKTLGVKSLRFGGTTVDGNDYTISHSDIDSLFAFAQAIDAKVIYCLRLKTYSGENKAHQYKTEAQDVQYIMSKYPDLVDCFCLGNEPNVFYPDYALFEPDWLQFTQTINQAVPAAKFCGPSAWNSTEKLWLLPFVKDFEKSPNLSYITEHIYQSQAPKFRLPRGMVDPKKEAKLQAEARGEMLGKNDFSNYYNAFVPEIEQYGVKYRIEETNSFSGGGVPNASDTHSATLWGLNYELWWACHEAQGINFHTGVHRIGSPLYSNYSVFSSSGTGQVPWGLSYSMLAFKLMSQGQVVRTLVDNGSTRLNLTAYTVLGADGSLYLTLINEEFGPSGHGASVTISMRGYSIGQVQTMTLVQSSGDVSFNPGKSTGGSITLGNAPITTDGSWNGDWSAPLAVKDIHTLNACVSEASALLLKLSPAH